MRAVFRRLRLDKVDDKVGDKGLTSARRWLGVALVCARAVLPSAGAPGASEPVSVHVVNGLWHREYRLDEAFARLGVSRVTESWHVSRWGFGTPGNWGSRYTSWVEDFPETTNDLAGYGLVVVCNIDGRALAGKRASDRLKDYVERGGTVLFLGGRYSFGKEYDQTPLEEIAPVNYTNRFDLELAPEGLTLKPGADAPQSIRDLAWGQSPRIYWYHRFRPKPGSKTLLEADGKPILVSARFGKGGVCVFAGTVMGAPPREHVPFWGWSDWPAVLAAALKTEWRPAAASAGDGAAEAEEAAKRMVRAAVGGTPVSNQLRRLLRFCSRPTVLQPLLEAVAASEGDIAESDIDTMGDAICPWLDGSHAALARQLVGSGHVNKGCLGLRLLGATRDPNAAETIRAAWTTGALRQGDLDSLSESDSMLGEQRIRDAALTALGDLGNEAAVKILRTSLPGLSGGAYPAGANPEEIGQPNRLYQQAMLAELRCGDEGAAGPVVDFLMENFYVIARGRTWETCVPNYVSVARRHLPEAKTWQARMLTRLTLVPDSVLAALARRIAAETDWRVTPIALGVFGGRTLDDSVRSALATSPVPAVAALSASHSP